MASESQRAQAPPQRVHFGLNVDLQLSERTNVSAGGEYGCGGLRGERDRETDTEVRTDMIERQKERQGKKKDRVERGACGADVRS